VTQKRFEEGDPPRTGVKMREGQLAPAAVELNPFGHGPQRTAAGARGCRNGGAFRTFSGRKPLFFGAVSGASSHAPPGALALYRRCPACCGLKPVPAAENLIARRCGLIHPPWCLCSRSLTASSSPEARAGGFVLARPGSRGGRPRAPRKFLPGPARKWS
jgi:hypothetical protein